MIGAFWQAAQITALVLAHVAGALAVLAPLALAGFLAFANAYRVGRAWRRLRSRASHRRRVRSIHKQHKKSGRTL